MIIIKNQKKIKKTKPRDDEKKQKKKFLMGLKAKYF